MAKPGRNRIRLILYVVVLALVIGGAAWYVRNAARENEKLEAEVEELTEKVSQLLEEQEVLIADKERGWAEYARVLGELRKYESDAR